MSGLRMKAHVVSAARHVHVEVLQQFGHLADEDVAPPLRLHEIDRAREAPVGPTRERGHSCGIARVAATGRRRASRAYRTGAVRAAASTSTACAPAATWRLR